MSSFTPMSFSYNLSGYLKPLGIEYFRTNASGYGYLIITLDIDSEAAYASGVPSAYRIDLDNQGTILSNSGFWPGVDTQSFDIQGTDELLTPQNSGDLQRKYPLTRRILDDSGVYWDIDHYEPYKGWVRDQNWDVIANADYSGDFYYDTSHEKVWFRTAYNNPYGSGNYTTVYLPLRNNPIFGSMKLYDIDIIDNNGDATEIERSGSPLYYYKSSNMGQGSVTGVWDPTYLGYDPQVPTDRGFGSIEGKTASLVANTCWDYQREGGGLNNELHRYEESSSGTIDSVIKIVNPYSRYIAEYSFVRYKKAKYITSLEGTKYLSLSTDNPIYSLHTVLNNEELLDYRFTRDPRYRFGEYVTFDGWKIRPSSRISRIDFKLPVRFEQGNVISMFNVPYEKDFAGYSSEHKPDTRTSREYVLDCPFDQTVAGGSTSELDLTGNGNTLNFMKTGLGWLYRIPYNGHYGKKIFWNSGATTYYEITSLEFLKKNTHFWFKFRPVRPQEITLLETAEATGDHYTKLRITRAGQIVVEANGTELWSRYKMSFDGEKEIILKYYPDEEFTTNPKFEIYIKDGTTVGFTKLNPFEREITKYTVSSTYLHVYKNCMIDVDTFKIYYEV